MTTLNARLTRRAFLGGAATFGAAAMVSPKNAFADPTSADVQAQADEARQKLNSMREQLGVASANYNQAVQEHDEAVSKMDECQTKIDDNNAQIDKLQDKLSKRARNMYRDGQTTFLDVILGSNSFDDFMKNWDMLTRMNENDAKMVAETKELRADNEAQRDEYSKQEREAAYQMEEADKAVKEGTALAEQFQASYDALSSEAQALYDQERQAALAAEAQAAIEQIQQESEPEPSNNNGASNNNGGNSNNGGGNNGGGDTSPSYSTNNYIPPSGSVVDFARSQIGVPYEWGGSTPNVGLDCSGLTSWCWQQATGISIGRTDGAQYSSARWRGPLSEAQPGDVLWTSGHVGICTSAGGGSYIHAPQPGQTVCESSWPQFVCALRW